MASGGPALQKIIEPVVGRFLSGEYESNELAARIHVIIEDQSQHLPSQITFSSLMTKFVGNGLDLLNHNDSKEPVKYKIAGLTIFDCLLDVNDEIMPERRIEIANHIGKVLETDKLPLMVNEIILRTASLSIGHFARVASTTEVEFLQNYFYPLAMKLIGDRRSDSHRFAGALILTQLAHFSPALIFSKRKVLFNVIWEAVCDKNKTVRAAAATSLEASLQVISQREAMSDYVKSALKQIDIGFTSTTSSSTAEKILGSLIILDTLMSGTIVTFTELYNTLRQQGVSVQDIIWKVIQRKDWSDADVRMKIIELIPNMAAAFSNTFVQPNSYTAPHSFLSYSLRHYMDLILARKERESCYNAIGRLFIALPSFFKNSPNISDIFNAITSGFKDPFCIHALSCMGALVNTSAYSRRFIDNKVIDLMFRGGLTIQLIDALKIIIKHIPGIRPYAQSKLKQAAAGILSKYTVSIDEKRSGSNAKTPTTATPKEPPSRSWFSSSRSSTVQEIPVATAAVVSAEKMEEEVVFALEVLAMTEFYPKVRDRAATSMSFTRMSGDGKSFASSMLPFASGNATTTGTSGTNSTSFPHPPLHPSTVLSGAQQQSSSLAQPSGIVSLNPPSNTAEEHEAIELLSIMRESVLRYLDDFSPRIRQAAMHACATVLNTVLPMIDLASTSHFYLSHQILDRLLIMGVGDDSCLIRQKVFTSFTPALDRLLSLTDNVHCLIEGLNDEILQVRVAAMTVLGRVAHFDSLHVLPTVRLVLKRLIFTLNTSQDSRVKLESVQLLQALVKGMETLIIPYVKQILDPLMALLSHHVTDIVVVALSTIGDLALSSHENVREHLDELAPRLIDVLNDESSIVKQETAVVALGKFVSSLTTVTEEPYKRYDGLFEGLVKATQNVDESSNELRLQAIKTLGLLGAVDTEVYQKHLMKSNAAVLNPQPEESGDAIDGNNNSDDEDYGKEKEDGMMMMILGQGNARRAAPPGNMTSPSQHYPPPSSNYASQKEEDPRVGKIERYYFSVVIRGLMTILRDNGLTFYHQTAITTAIRAIRMIGNRADCELNEVISAIVFRLFTDSGNNIKDALLDHLITLIHILGKSMVRHSRILVRIIQEFLRSHLQLCLDIFESMGSIFPTSDFNVILKDVFPMLLAMMEEEAFLSSPGSGNLGISLLPNGEDVYVVDGNAKQQSGYLMAASTSDRLHLPRNRNSLNASAGAAASAAVASNAALANPTPSNASGTSANAATTGVNGSSATGSGSGVVKSGNSGAKTSKIMQKLVNMNEVLGEYRRDSLPFLISLFGSELLSWEVKREVVCTLLCLSNENDLLEYSGRIIHALLRLLTDLTNSSAVLAGTSSSSTTGATTNAELALFNTIFNALSTFVCRLGTGFLPYVIPIRRKIRSIPMLSKYDLLNGGISLSASASSSSGSSQGRLVRLEEYEVLVTRLLKNRPLPNEPPDSSDLLCRVDERVRNRATTTRIYRDRENSTQQINMTNLETAWALSGRNNASDLIQWMGRLTIELIRQSPSPILRSCATLAKTYRPLAEELFNTSFHSIWEELFQNQYSQEIITDIPLITGMEIALESNQIPKNIMIALLNLAEFMDMQDQRLPIDMELLARRAQDANMFAKCLRFREIQFSSKNMVPSFECIDGMVSINNQLGLPDRAIGILRYLRLKYPMIEIQPRWLEKLLRYEDAYMAYEQDIATCKTLFGGGAGAEDHRVANPFKYERWINSELGRLRCLHALGEMDELAYHAEQLKNWLIAYKDEKEKAAVGSGHGAAAASTATDGEAAVLSPVMIAEIQKLGAHAAWRLGNWEKMEEFLDDTLLGSTEGNALATAATASSPAMPNMIEIIRHVDPKDVVLEHNIVFYHTILAIHQRDYHKALSFIHEIRSTLSGAIAALLSESYSRAYRAMVTMQTLAELEEVVEYKCCIAKANLDSEKVAMPIITDLTNEAAPNGSLALNLETTFASNVNGIASVAGAESSSGGAAATGGGSGASEKGVDLAVKKAALLDKWKARLKWAPKDIEVYRSILSVHTLVAEPEEDLDSWIELVTLCRKEGAHSLCANLLRKLGAPLQPTRTEHQEDGGHEANTAPAIESPRVAGSPASKGKSTSAGNASPSAAGSAAAASPTIAEGITPLVGSTKDLNAASPRTNDRILLATYQYWWSHGEKERALRELTNYLRTSSLPPTDAAHSSNPATPVGPLAVSTAAAAAAAAAATVNAASGGPSPWKSSQEALMFRVRCLLKRAEWMESLEETNNVHEILSTLMEARDLAKDQYSVWHAWAVANYDQLKKVSTDDNAGAASPNPADASGARPSSASSSSAGSSTASSADSGTTSFPSYASSTASAAPVPPPPPRSASVTITKGIGGNAHHHAGANLTVKLHSTSGTATLLNLVSVSQQQADKVTTYVIEGIKGFVRSIVLGQGQPVANLLQDTLRLITLLFSYGSKKGVFQILDLELEKVPPENWLSVVPQLIARIHIKSPEISGLLRKLLCKVAASHPQALVCPISVAKNTSDNRQRAMATDVLAEVRKHNKQLVEEATMVSRELMRVAITPQELWFDGLEQAAQLYLDAKDISGMLAVLKDLHETMTEAPPTVASGTGWTATATGAGGAKSGAGSGQEGFSEGLGKIGVTTLRDVAFRQAYAKVLLDAWYWIEQFRSTGRTIDLHQAWEIYQSIFKKIKVQIAALKKLELHHVSPALTAAKELTLAVPGTYRPSAPIISINSFSPAVHVITSKQRPRKMCLMGSDGGKYPFLLKGHEDLRQDERVMQLFGLINVCLQNDRITSRHGLDIIRYSVLPLSNNSGLIGWVDNCDTLNQLIKRYRETKEIRLLMEMKLLQSKSSAHYDKLTVLQKTELFQQVLDETTGEDLMRMLWLKSKSSDVWIERRANFTKSLAVMSMVGYILGLGDRHPSNLMLDRISGRVVHIDFGDCFEITKHRAKYPEIVPFRLTRMLTNCMGVAGIEGTYRLTSERVMRVIRDNRYSVMAMLEAFVYDPLISWRLLAKHNVQAAPPDQTISRVNSGDDSKSPMEKMGLALQGGASFRDVGTVLGNGSLDGPEGAMNVANITQMERSPRRGMVGGAASLLHRGHELPRALSQEGMGLGEDEPFQENLNARALEVINRIQAKLTGRDFAKSEDSEDLEVADQVDRLIKEATSIENLCQLFSGWCPLW